MKVVVDFETSSEADLKKVGTYAYANHETTWPTCLSYKIGNNFADIWLTGQEFPQELRDCIDKGYDFHAFNCSFEWMIWKYCCVAKLNWPSIPFRLWHCSRAQAAYYGMPRALDNVCRVLDLGDDGKDKEGHKAMLKVCAPNKLKRDIKARGQWGKAPELLHTMWDYCIQDSECESTIHERLPPLPASEHRIWQIDQAINARGIPVDLDLCRGADKIITEVTENANRIVADVTMQEDGTSVIDRPSQLQRIKDWCGERKVFLPDMSESTIRDILEFDKDMDPSCRALLKARADTNSAAVKKFRSALAQADEHGFCRNAHDFYGAVTGRWAAKGVQFQNLRRVDKGFKVTQDSIDAIISGDLDAVSKFGDPINVLANHVRSMVKAPKGYAFAYADFASIEARVLAWFACDSDTIQAFKDGTCLYSKLAAKIFGVPLGDIKNPSMERNVGKAGVLGLGFKMGWKTFQLQVKKQAGIDLPDALCEDVVRIYREEFKLVVDLWRQLEQSAFMAIRNKGKAVAGRGWSYQYEGDWLTLKLPSGRKLYYYDAFIDPEGRYGQPEICYTGPTGKAWLSVSVLVENLVQATARDLQSYALVQCHKEKLPVVLHVHDDIKALVKAEEAEGTASFMEEVMGRSPSWAAGIPIKAEGGFSERVS